MVIALQEASKQYPTASGTITALAPTTFGLEAGELMLIMGPSGSGKTTLLSLLGCLVSPTTGTVRVNNQPVTTFSARETARLRLGTIGFVFQQFNLLAPLTAEQNVAFPLKMQKRAAFEIRRRTAQALTTVNMMHRRNSLPQTLSGGEQQRIAIARALVTDPAVVLCDEPTASLDQQSLTIVMEELRGLARSGKSVAVVTHDSRLLPYADRAVEVNNGQVQPLALPISNAAKSPL